MHGWPKTIGCQVWLMFFQLLDEHCGPVPIVESAGYNSNCIYNRIKVRSPVRKHYTMNYDQLSWVSVFTRIKCYLLWLYRVAGWCMHLPSCQVVILQAMWAVAGSLADQQGYSEWLEGLDRLGASHVYAAPID